MIILYFDSRYFRWGPQLIESIQRHEPDEKVYIYGINLSDEQCDRLLRRYYNTIACLQRLELDFPITAQEGLLETTKAVRKSDELRFHIISRKGRFILNAMERFPKEELFFMFDVDMLMIKDLSAIKMQMADYDFAAIEANPKKICGGFYTINPTEITKEFLQEWDDFLMTGDSYWDKDQPSMSRILWKYRDNGLRFLPVERIYLDHYSRAEATIWSAHKSEFGDKDQRFKLYSNKLSEQVNDKLLCQNI